MKWCFYHAHCYDGFGAAWVVHYTKEWENAKFVPMEYGKTLPVKINTGDEVLFVDFSLPRQELLNLASVCKVTVLDHHKTAEEDLKGLPFVHFDMNRSGAVMTWEYFHQHAPVPRLILYIQDRDLWQLKLPHTKEISSWLRSFPYDFKVWEELYLDLQYDETFQSAVQQGRALLRSIERMVEEICTQSRKFLIDGHLVPVVNSNVFMSEVGQRLLELHPEAPFSAYYLDRADGRRQWGLRSKEFDVSEVAKKYGGGGHRNAAGFVTEQGSLPLSLPSSGGSSPTG